MNIYIYTYINTPLIFFSKDTQNIYIYITVQIRLVGIYVWYGSHVAGTRTTWDDFFIPQMPSYKTLYIMIYLQLLQGNCEH